MSVMAAEGAAGAMGEWEFLSRSPAETEALGRALGGLLRAGSGLALVGEMGAGKTLLARGVALGLGVEGAEEVKSPSYLLMLEYPGHPTLYHFDAYFAAKERDFLADGGQVLLEGEGVALVEWADRLEESLPSHFLRVTIEMPPGQPEWRRFRFRGPASIWGGVLARLAAALEAGGEKE